MSAAAVVSIGNVDSRLQIPVHRQAIGTPRVPRYGKRTLCISKPLFAWPARSVAVLQWHEHVRHSNPHENVSHMPKAVYTVHASHMAQVMSQNQHENPTQVQRAQSGMRSIMIRCVEMVGSSCE
jgi:hypothetical protein